MQRVIAVFVLVINVGTEIDEKLQVIYDVTLSILPANYLQQRTAATGAAVGIHPYLKQEANSLLTVQLQRGILAEIHGEVLHLRNGAQTSIYPNLTLSK